MATSSTEAFKRVILKTSALEYKLESMGKLLKKGGPMETAVKTLKGFIIELPTTFDTKAGNDVKSSVGALNEVMGIEVSQKLIGNIVDMFFKTMEDDE